MDKVKDIRGRENTECMCGTAQPNNELGIGGRVGERQRVQSEQARWREGERGREGERERESEGDRERAMKREGQRGWASARQ